MNGLQELRSAPTCNRLAVRILLDSCQSLDADTSNIRDDRLVLEDVTRAYAVSLAVCELAGANAAIPSPCNRFRQPVLEQVTVNAETQPYIDHSQLTGCLASMRESGIAWTSYSNNLQNAHVFCQASRNEIEKGQYYI